MIGVYLNPEDCDYLSNYLRVKLRCYACIPLTPEYVKDKEYIEFLLSKLDYNNLEVNKSVVIG